jgi:dihydropteroate synthase
MVDVEHSTESGKQIKFYGTEVLAKTSGYISRLLKEAIAIKLHPNSINRDEGFNFIKSRNPSTKLLKALKHTQVRKITRRHKEEHATIKIDLKGF